MGLSGPPTPERTWISNGAYSGTTGGLMDEHDQLSRSVRFPDISIEGGSFPVSQPPRDHRARRPAPDPSVAIRRRLVGTASDALNRNLSDRRAMLYTGASENPSLQIASLPLCLIDRSFHI